MSDDQTVSDVEYPDLPPGHAADGPATLSSLSDVTLEVTVQLGQVRLQVRDLLELTEGSVIELDRAVGAPVDVLANGALLARGDVVVVGDELGVRITELLRRA